ncbi:ZN383 protein, partial [Pomatorhinus ruficollis]|nr:ZN383 protein [Pomatorhinus ruficollis]
ATFPWPIVPQILPETSEKPRKTPKKPRKNPNFADFAEVVVLRKTFECPECGKTFGCGSHFAKHRRTHTG